MRGGNVSSKYPHGGRKSHTIQQRLVPRGNSTQLEDSMPMKTIARDTTIDETLLKLTVC